ncbi:hypothetical protein [Sphingomonas xinjiangensis]|uniref:Uncharacterized protein n=1 Tax=Sphingomonas xinjiangensis TaxID=643568 RepID=A0A840YTL4_9SPHN|nr:hypothetical protein [Sphingomonas xinjiangensis]MBB5713059.1 hypothetical protein [Sphingomonas xinjiangensis]
MSDNDVMSYIAALPLGEDPATKQRAFPQMASELGVGGKIDTANLPDGVVAGSNLVGFDGTVGAPQREAVALCMMAAERVADQDPVVNSPELWVKRYDMVLQGLGWIGSSGGVVDYDYSNRNVSVHEVVIPILTAAFGGAAVGGLIIKALEGLAGSDKDDPWITLFERESRHLDVIEYRFGIAEQIGTAVNLRIAAARLRADQKRLQILLFKSKSNEVSLKTSQTVLAAHEKTLEKIANGLRPRLMSAVDNFIRELPL